jgi:hypothetical protein
MKLCIVFAILMALGKPGVFAQVKTPTSQEAGDCVVNIMGNGNTASLKCENLDPKIAGQIQEILNRTKQNEKSSKEISGKLDLILKEVKRPNPRRIPPEKRAQIVATLARSPGKITVSANLGDAEAYQFAEDWLEAFGAAGWTMMKPGIVNYNLIGKPQEGLFIKFHGEEPKSEGKVKLMLSPDSPMGVIATSLNQLNLWQQVKVMPSPEFPEGELDFMVHVQPKN